MTESDSPSRDLLRVLLAAIQAGARGGLAIANPQQALAIARRHRLSPLLASTVAFDDDRIADACRSDRVAAASRNLVLVQWATRCIEALGRANVPVIVLKGLAYESLYPPGSRPTSDIDLLVPHAARRVAFETLDKLGFEPRACAPGFDDDDYHEVAWRQDGIEVDLHLALAPFVRCGIDYREVWEASVETTIGARATALLQPAHAAVFHALHMAIDHFEVPAIYLLDFVRLVATPQDRMHAESIAQRWRCGRPFATATALVKEFVPDWAAMPSQAPVPQFARAIVAGYGRATARSRARQLVRKFTHFDDRGDAIRYLFVQGRRNINELIERHVRKRSARARLALE